MTSKQWHKDNGPYTRIANKIIEVLMVMSLSGRDFRVLLAIMRATYGYGRKDRPLALSYIAKMTGLGRSQVSRSLAKLTKLEVLLKRQQKGVAELTTEVLLNRQQAKSVQVYGVNKSITKKQKGQGVASLATIKEMINFFKESAVKGGFGAAFTAWLKERKEPMTNLETQVVELFSATIAEIGQYCRPEHLATIETDHPDILAKMQKAEGKLEDWMDRAIAGEVSLAQLKRVLGNYRDGTIKILASLKGNF